MQITKEIIIAVFQILLMIAFYPILIFAVIMRNGTRIRNFDGFKIWKFYCFPICGKWYLPTLDFYF